MAGPWEKYQAAEAKPGAPWEKYAQAAPAAAYDPVQETLNKSGTAGAIDTALALGTGAVAAPIAGIAGILQGARNLISPALPTMNEADKRLSAGDVVDKVQNALQYEPRTPMGKAITSTIAYPFQKLAQAGDAAGAATANATNSPAVGAGVNTALQSVPLLIGRVPKIAERMPTKLQSVSDQAAVKAQEAGYKLPPTQVNDSFWNKLVEGAAGKIKTGQDLSIKDQANTNRLVRKGLGLADDAELTPQTLAQIRKDAGQAYEQVRNSGQVTADAAYGEALDKVSAPFERAAKDFPDAARTDVLDAVKAARRGTFDAGSAVDQISILRDKADASFSAKDKKLGGAYKGIANALEEQLGRHLENSGVGAEALDAFRNARQQIAKTYTVEKHLQPSGNVDVRGLAADLKRGKPLTGELKTAAEFGANFPRAAQLPEKIGGSPMSPFDHAIAGTTLLASIASGHPGAAVLAAAPYARPLLRKLIGSDSYQSNFVKPRESGPGIMSRLQELQSSPVLQEMEMAQGQRQ